MATVRITQTLRGEIERNVNDKFTARFDTIDKRVRELLSLIDHETLIWGPLLPHIKAVQHRLDCDSIRIRLKITRGDVELFRVQLNTEKAIVVDRKQGDWSFEGYTIPEDYAQVPELHELHDKKVQLEEEKERFKKQVLAAVDGFSTLNQLIKVWPAVESLLPEYALKRIREKVERKKTEEAEVDLQELNTQLLKAQILGG